MTYPVFVARAMVPARNGDTDMAISTKYSVYSLGRAVTAQGVWDALSASPYMDHVVDAWISAEVALERAEAVRNYIMSTSGLQPWEVDDRPEAITAEEKWLSARATLDAAIAERDRRWSEYTGKKLGGR